MRAVIISKCRLPIADLRTAVATALKLAIGNWQSAMFLLLLVVLAVISLSCIRYLQPSRKELSLAVVSGVEGEALKQAALDYETKTGVHINVAQFPYANLFEKEMIDF